MSSGNSDMDAALSQQTYVLEEGKESNGEPVCKKCTLVIDDTSILRAQGNKFHPACFTCYQCGKLCAKDKFFPCCRLPFCSNQCMSKFVPDQKQDYGHICWANKCLQALQTGDKYVTTSKSDHRYHVTCFGCQECKKSLAGLKFVLFNGNPFCNRKCAEDSTCWGCQKSVGRKAHLVAIGRKWHEECFVCFECKQKLEGKFVKCEGFPYHRACLVDSDDE